MTITPDFKALYPHCSTLDAAWNVIRDQIPEVEPNKLFSLIMLYHNTLLYQQEHQQGTEHAREDV